MHMQAIKLRNIAIFSPLVTVRNRVTVYQLLSSMSFGLCEECKPHYILRLSSYLMRKQCGVEIKRRNVIEIKPKKWQFLCILKLKYDNLFMNAITEKLHAWNSCAHTHTYIYILSHTIYITFITKYITLLHKQKYKEKYFIYYQWTGLWMKLK